MKKLIVLISLLVMAVTAYSQQLRPGSLTITPKMGINASSYYGSVDNADLYNSVFSLTLGYRFNVK